MGVWGCQIFNSQPEKEGMTQLGSTIWRIWELLEPQLPVKFLNFIIPSGMDVDSIGVSASFQMLEGLYNILHSRLIVTMLVEQSPLPHKVQLAV